MYEIGDIIYYCNEGVCRVEGIETLDISGIDCQKPYYNLSPVYHAGSIYIPVDTKLFMRPIIGSEEVHRLITLIPMIKVSVASHSSRRMLEESYNQYLQTHQCIDLIRLLKAVHIKAVAAEKERKKLGAIDERFRKRAEELLTGEFAVALNIPRESVKDYIQSKIDESGIKDLAI